MKKSRLMPLMLTLLCIGMLASISVVYAPWQTLGTGYAITTNYHEVDVLPGNPVTATAGTLDPGVVKVTFRWHRPPDGNGTLAWEDEVSPLLTSPYPPPNVPQEVIDYVNSTTIWYAQDTRVLDEVGDWGVQVFFQGPSGNKKANVTDVIKIRAESFNVIPEVPLGTIAVTISMLAALGIFALKKKRF